MTKSLSRALGRARAAELKLNKQKFNLRIGEVTRGMVR